MAKKKREECIVCGRIIGTATGWDQSDAYEMTFYDFIPITTCQLPTGDISIRFEKGIVEAFNDDGTIKTSTDLIDSIKHLPIKRTG